MSEAAAALLREVEALRNGRARVELAVVWQAFATAVPSRRTEPDARRRLRELLDALAATGALRLPSRRWDRSAQPPLPLWVQVLDWRPGALRRDHRTVAWAPELGFVAGLPRVDDLDELLSVQEFLGKGGRERPVVPVRERSVELFGDEKRLEVLAKGRLFGPRRLSLSLLRCEEVPPPIAWKPGPRTARGRPILVVENLHTWHSLCRWNEREATWAAVVFGEGQSFPQRLAALPRVLSESVAAPLVDYFGDLDAAGLAIPAQARSLVQGQGFVDLRPATELYRLLFQRGEALQQGGPDQRTVTEEGRSWLGPELSAIAAPWLGSQRRLAQELVGWETLAPLRAQDLGVAGETRTGEEWLGPSALRAWWRQDPLLDWLDLWGQSAGFVPDSLDPGWRDLARLRRERLEALTALALARVAEVCPGEPLVDLRTPGRRRQSPPQRAAATLEHLGDGPAVLARGVLANEVDHTWAEAPLLVRCDVLERAWPGSLSSLDEGRAPAPDLGRVAGHYRLVFPVTGDLRRRPRSNRSAHSLLANQLLGLAQGYLPPRSYELGYDPLTSGPGLTPMPWLSRARKGSHPHAQLAAALTWARRVRAEGRGWVPLPDPTVPELRPNLKNRNDAPWRSAKARLAAALEEPTAVWGVGPRQRGIAASAAVHRWTDGRFTPELLGLEGERARVLEAVLAANRSGVRNTTQLPSRVPGAIDLFLDVETAPDPEPGPGPAPTRLVLLGCGWAQQAQWHYEPLAAPALSAAGEACLVERVREHLAGLRHALGCPSFRLIHWSSADPRALERACQRAAGSLDLFGPHTWFDLHRWFVTQPVALPGALDFQLESVAHALELPFRWDADGPLDGRDAHAWALRCALAARTRGVELNEVEGFQPLVRYNELDCRALWAITQSLGSCP